MNSRFRSGREYFAVLSLLVAAGGRSVARVFPDRKLSRDHDCGGKCGQEEEEE